MNKNIFFQSSLPRAGSTLLQNLMGQNPEFYVTPTSGVLELLYSARGQFSTSPEFKAQDSETMKKGWRGFCERGIQGFYNEITAKPYVIDKSRGWGIHYDFLTTFIDNPKVICMVRDPRAIFASMEKNFRKNPEEDSGIVNWSTGQCTNVEKRIEHFSNTIPLGLAFNRLSELFNRGFSENILFVRYEDLCSRPQAELDRIYNYLGVKEYKHDFNKITQITEEDDTVYGMQGLHNIKSTLEAPIRDFEQVLGSYNCDKIYNNYRWIFDKFGYSK